jgi:hypothetical protein
VPLFRTVSDHSTDDNDDDSGASRHLHLQDVSTRIVPGRVIGLCLRIRRLGVRIPSGAPSSEALSVSVEASRLIIDDSFDDLTGGADTVRTPCGHPRTEMCDWLQRGPFRVTEHLSKPNKQLAGRHLRQLRSSCLGAVLVCEAPSSSQ